MSPSPRVTSALISCAESLLSLAPLPIFPATSVTPERERDELCEALPKSHLLNTRPKDALRWCVLTSLVHLILRFASESQLWDLDD